MTEFKVVRIIRGFYKGTPVTLYMLLHAENRLTYREAIQKAIQKAEQYQAEGYQCRRDRKGTYTCTKGTDVVLITVLFEDLADLAEAFPDLVPRHTLINHRREQKSRRAGRKPGPSGGE